MQKSPASVVFVPSEAGNKRKIGLYCYSKMFEVM